MLVSGYGENSYKHIPKIPHVIYSYEGYKNTIS